MIINKYEYRSIFMKVKYRHLNAKSICTFYQGHGLIVALKLYLTSYFIEIKWNTAQSCILYRDVKWNITYLFILYIFSPSSWHVQHCHQQELGFHIRELRSNLNQINYRLSCSALIISSAFSIPKKQCSFFVLFFMWLSYIMLGYSDLSPIFWLYNIPLSVI